MKKIWNISLLIGIVVFGTSCANEVDLTADFEDIPVVYGILSVEDEAHYIRVERAFLGGDGDNALEIAQIADSIFYEDLDVKLEEVSSGNIYSLNRVDGNDEGYTREVGIFAANPNYLYKTTETLTEGREYILRINRGDDKEEVTASTTIVSNFTFTNPQSTQNDINIRYRSSSLAWKKTDDAFFYDLKMQINYLEEDPGNPGVFSEESILWDVKNNILAEGSNTFGTTFDGEEFYRFLGGELDDNGGAERIFVSLSFVVDAGGQAIYDFINIGQANTGITSSQVIPTFTNLSEGFGILSSRNRAFSQDLTLKAESRDSLANGVYTKQLGFQF